MKEDRNFIVMMCKVCAEEGISLTRLSYDWVLRLEKNGITRYVIGNNFDLNGQASGNIARDKYATFAVLKSKNVSVVEHVILFNPNTSKARFIDESGNTPIISNEFNKHKKLVVKPNHGCQGHGVVLCNSMKETEAAIQQAFKSNDSISICPYYDIDTEYRVFYLNGSVELIYGKTKPFVIGDGKTSLAKLIESLNFPDKSAVYGKSSKLDLSYIPAKNEKYYVSWKHNLCGGATAEILQYSTELYKRIEALALKAGKAMNINFATIDIIKTTDDELYVLEINSGVCSTIFVEALDEGYALMKEIYRKAVRSLFD